MASNGTIEVNVKVCGVADSCDDETNVVTHYGPPRSTTPAQRAVRGTAHHYEHRKVRSMADIKADQEIPLSANWLDEVGNSAAAPADSTVVFTSNNPDSVVIVVADDGVTVARATGSLDFGPATIHMDASWTDGAGNAHTATGDDILVPVAGDAERVSIALGDAREVTPDNPPAPEA